MTTLRKAAEIALEALEAHADIGIKSDKAIFALREALAQPEPKPFGYFQYSMHLDAWVQNKDECKGVAFYTHPPQRKPLTDGEIRSMWGICEYPEYAIDFAREIELAHGIGGEE